MTTEYFTLIAAGGLAAVTSIITLVLNSKLTLHKEKRMVIWEKEIERFQLLEEKLGLIQEIVIRHSHVETLNEDFATHHDELKYLAGSYCRHPELAKSIRRFVCACDGVYNCKVEHKDYRESEIELNISYKDVLAQCDIILNPPTLFT
ncbi:hypothetical protein ACET57_18790 [Aeromonas veronii]|uniref:hypothetical protein n=1 Tax=Aeromonas TaxID=642 RepID=UPI0038D30145